ncbi:MAG: sigma-70 family RNA polymerase sigma factor [Planctomycetaceae bacterium]
MIGPDLERYVAASDTSRIPYLRDPDVQLMLRAQQGDEAAFAELVQTYQDRLIGIFRHLLSDQDAAEDLAQEVFLRIYRARDRYQPTARFSTWLFRIANNLASNKRRSKGRRREVALNIHDSGPIGIQPQEKLIADKSAFMPTRQAAKSEMREVVRGALESLNERQKMALLLHKFEGMSYSDIGVSMDMSAAAVKSLLSRARDSLREKLARYVNGV